MISSDGAAGWTAHRVAGLLRAAAGLQVRFLDRSGATLGDPASLAAAGHDEDFLLERARGGMPIGERSTAESLRVVLAWWTGCDLVVLDPRRDSPASGKTRCTDLMDPEAIQRLNRLLHVGRDEVQDWLSRQGATLEIASLLSATGVRPAGVTRGSSASAAATPYDGREPFLFISYRHPDREAISVVVKALQDAGVRLWWDRDLVMGEAYAEVIQARLRACAGVLLFLTPKTVERQTEEWVYEETRFAIEHGREVLPLQLAGTTLPIHWRALLGHRHAVTLDGWDDHSAMERIVERARAIGCMRPEGLTES